MSDPTAVNEILKQVMDAYRVFSIELSTLQMKKSELVKTILARVDGEQTQDINQVIKQIIYERKNSS